MTHNVEEFAFVWAFLERQQANVQKPSRITNVEIMFVSPHDAKLLLAEVVT